MVLGVKPAASSVSQQALARGRIEMRQHRLARGGRWRHGRPAADAVGEADGLHGLALVDVEDLRGLQDSEPHRLARQSRASRSSSGSAAPRRSNSFQTRCAISNSRTPSR